MSNGKRQDDEPGMTQREWLESAAPQAMLNCEAMDGASPRKLRLFACACCRRIWRLMPDDASRAAVETAERYADELATDDELAMAHRIAWEAHLQYDEAAYYAAQAAAFVTNKSSAFAARECTDAAYGASVCDPDDPELEPAAQAALIRCVFRNPFQPPRQLSLSCLTADVVRLAREIYVSRAFHRMPELGDVLEHAGCADAEILQHCRETAPHVRGCWVVDLLAGAI